jgi:capsular exopolysaccharide synthesis family protein
LNIHEYLRVLRRSWILIVATTLAGLLVGAAVSLATPPTYVSNTQLFVATPNTGSIQDLQAGDSFGQARVQSYARTAKTAVVLQPAIDSLGLSMTTNELAPNVDASTEVNTVLINIAVSDHSPTQAAALAQTIANSLIAAVEKLEKSNTGASSPVSLSVITPAKVPAQASSPNIRLNLMLGLLVGLTMGVGAGILRSVLDSRVRSVADLRQVTSASLLGGIALDTDAFSKPLITQIDQQSPRAESFRQLRTNLQFANVAGSAKSVLVTSSVPGEGKTTIAANLAIAIAQAGQKVCLVDADLRRPTMSEYFGLDGNAGVTTFLAGNADVSILLQQWGADQLYILPAGQIPPNPSELLGSAAMKDLILRLETSFDTVILDAPPILPVTDAVVLSQHVSGVLVVVNAQLIKQRVLAKTLSALELVGAKILGVVLNRQPATGPDVDAYTYISHSTAKDEARVDAGASTPASRLRPGYHGTAARRATGG